MDALSTVEFIENLNTKELETKHLNLIGIEAKKSKELAGKLDTLLASYSVFYQNVRGYHWNLKGENFFVLHVKFEELYTHLYLRIDEIAERIQTIGHYANHNFSHYKMISKIPESSQINIGIKAAEDVLASLQTIISLQREALSFSSQIADEGTFKLMSDNISAQEKLVWMYAAFLGK
jgi:starvation-inducible DNA-binding protein